MDCAFEASDIVPCSVSIGTHTRGELNTRAAMVLPIGFGFSHSGRIMIRLNGVPRKEFQLPYARSMKCLDEYEHGAAGLAYPNRGNPRYEP